MPTSLLQWLRARRTRTELRAVGELPVSRLLLEVDSGDPTENPMTGSKVLAYRIDLGFVREGLAIPKGSSSRVPGRHLLFTKVTETAWLPEVVLRSRDGVRVLVRAQSYTVVDDVTEFGVELDPRHPSCAMLPFPWQAGRLPGYRSFSLAEGQVIAVRAALRPLASGGGAYRGEPARKGVTLDLYDPANAPLVLHDLVGHPGLEPVE